MWSPTISPDELCHYGVKDMSWGKRRWQNPDGSLTPAGRIHYGVGNSTSSMWNDAKGNSRHSSSRNSGSERKAGGSKRGMNGNDAEKALKASSNISNESSKIAKRASEKGYRDARNEIDLSGMSNKELHVAINRMSLEKQYKDLALADVRSGWDVAADILDVAGSVMAIGASAATIYALTRKR